MTGLTCFGGPSKNPPNQTSPHSLMHLSLLVAARRSVALQTALVVFQGLETEIKQSGISSVGDEKAFGRVDKALPDNPLQIHIPRINFFCYRRGGLCQSRPDV